MGIHLIKPNNRVWCAQVPPSVSTGHSHCEILPLPVSTKPTASRICPAPGGNGGVLSARFYIPIANTITIHRNKYRCQDVLAYSALPILFDPGQLLICMYPQQIARFRSPWPSRCHRTKNSPGKKFSFSFVCKTKHTVTVKLNVLYPRLSIRLGSVLFKRLLSQGLRGR